MNFISLIINFRLLESKRRTKERQQLVRTNKKSLEGLVIMII